MFVFGEVQDPLPETVRLVEDIVRGQIIEIVCYFSRLVVIPIHAKPRNRSPEPVFSLIFDPHASFLPKI